jgi:hypothetical protein
MTKYPMTKKRRVRREKEQFVRQEETFFERRRFRRESALLNRAQQGRD